MQQPPFLKVKEHTLRDIDDDPVVNEVGNDVAIVDMQPLPDLQKRVRRQVVMRGEGGDADAESRADAGEGISTLNDVVKLAAGELVRKRRSVLTRCRNDRR